MIKKLIITAQTILGLIFVVFGLNGFFHFLEIPPMAQSAQNFMTALVKTGYMMPLVKGIEVLGGLLLLSTRFIPLALLLLGPIVVNILFFHIFLDMSGLPIGVVLAVLYLFLVWDQRSVFKAFFK